MTVLHIYKLDSDEDAISQLQEGEHIIGRGDLLQCDDRRVSRNHGVIKITQDEVTITSTHINPCFYQPATGRTIVILTRGNPVHLGDGDKFALLADKFWYKIKLNDSTNNGKYDLTDAKCSSLDLYKTLHVTKRGVDEDQSPNYSKKLKTEIDEPDAYNLKGERKNFHNKDENDLKNVLEELEVTAGSSINSETEKQQIDVADNMLPTTSRNRRYNGSRTRNVSVKEQTANKTKQATKSNNAELHDAKIKNAFFSSDEDDFEIRIDADNTAIMLDQNNIKVPSVIITDDTDNNKRKDDNGENALPTTSSHKGNNVNGIRNGSDKKQTSNKTKQATKSKDAKLNDSKVKNTFFSSDEDDFEIRIDADNTAGMIDQNDIKAFNASVTDNTDNNKSKQPQHKNEKIENKQEMPIITVTEGNGEQLGSKNVKNEDDQNTESGSLNDVNKAGPSDTNTKKTRRDRCWYGIECYRKSKTHLAEFCHPGDSDHESDPKDNRPMCAYGAACYRRNQDHRKAYKHPRNKQKPSDKKTKKRRAPRQQYNDTPEDDYDLDDPFINDSESEYEVDSDSEDSDPDWSEGSQEETKRLLKEAKRFTRGKKGDKGDDD